MRYINLPLNDDLFHKLCKRAQHKHRNLTAYIVGTLADHIDYPLSYEKVHYIGVVVSGRNIVDNYGTVVLGGSNYSCEIEGQPDMSVNTGLDYQIVDFADGQAIIKAVQSNNRKK